MKNTSYRDARITGGFWKQYRDLVRNTTIKCVYDRFSETGRFDALSCRGKTHIYWDSDVAKWLEAAAYLMAEGPSPELEQIADRAIQNIKEHQLPSGYYNSHFLAEEPENIFTRRDDHELYCAGHLIEAAIAYAEATGKKEFLACMIRYADHIYQVFYAERSAAFHTPGHPELELALIRLAEYTGDEKYRTLAKYFIDERGKDPKEEEGTRYLPGMTLSEKPFRTRKEASGHAVRAQYLYAAAAASGDRELIDKARTLFLDIVNTKMAVTGGVGAFIAGEAFGKAYHLPNRTSYNETCAAIALVLLAERLQETELDPVYADTIERVLYNGMLSGLSLSGDAFFYENALEIDLSDYDLTSEMTAAEAHRLGLLHNRRLARAKVFSTSCCPPNLCRTIVSLGRFLYSQDGDRIICHQFAESTAHFTVKGKPAGITMHTDYPLSGKVTFVYEGEDTELFIRIPGWCPQEVKDKYLGKKRAETAEENCTGYAAFSVTDGSVVMVDFPMEVRFVEGNPKVADTSGKAAVMRGPVVYCLESVDNGETLWDIELDTDRPAETLAENDFPLPCILLSASRRPARAALYQEITGERENITAKLIPYFAFANRGITNMQIWTNCHG